MSPHRVVRCALAPAGLAALRAIDYNEAPLGAIPYGSIQTAREADGYKWALKEEVLAEGVRVPAVLVQRNLTPIRIVDGHHRARLALDLGLLLPAELHRCACPSTALDYFGLCAFVKASVARWKRMNVEQERMNHAF